MYGFALFFTFLLAEAVISFSNSYNSWFLFYALSNNTNNSAIVYYLLTFGLFLIYLALYPNLKEEMDSPAL